jgi:2-dehydro-3-deoxyphosphogluconate aldolase / (4S)-4-hydroxy-2-oxoglutarate aldolase
MLALGSVIEASAEICMLLEPQLIFRNAPVVPVVTIEHASDAVPLAKALVAGGLAAIEVTLRTNAALDAVTAITEQVPEAVVGLGTVLHAGSIVEFAVRAGVKFLVSPGTTRALAEAFADAPIPCLPGCATVSEAMMLADRGFQVLKFFPAEASGGIAWLKAVAAPLPDIRFCPSGGINRNNAAAYLALPNVAAVGGTWVAPQDAIAAGDFARITALAREAAQFSS